MAQLVKKWWWNDDNDNYNMKMNHQTSTAQSVNNIYWFECIGMFIFVYLQACTKQPTGIHLQITFVLMMAIPMCAKISGAHYNPAVTVSNYLCRFNKAQYSHEMMWMYFKAQLYSAIFALALGYILNNHFLAGLALPNEQISGFQIFLSQFLATAILVFYTQLAANNETNFTTTDAQKYFFIIAFVFVARRSAHVSAFAINPAITMATVFMDVVTCRFAYHKICFIYLAGDFLGAIFGSLFYNKFYVPNLEISRNRKSRSSFDVQQQQFIPSLQKADSNLREQSSSFSKNYQQLESSFEKHSIYTKNEKKGSIQLKS